MEKMLLITISRFYSLCIAGDDDKIDCQLFFLKVKRSMPAIVKEEKREIKELYQGVPRSSIFLNGSHTVGNTSPNYS